MKLIPEWREAYKLWSVRLSTLGALLMGFLLAWPDSLLYLWSMMPPEVYAYLPERIVQGLAMFIFVMSVISRLVKQRLNKDE